MSIPPTDFIHFNNKDILKQDFVNALFQSSVEVFPKFHFIYDASLADPSLLYLDPNDSPIKWVFDRFLIASCLSKKDRHTTDADLSIAAQCALESAPIVLAPFKTSCNGFLDLASALAYQAFTTAQSDNEEADLALHMLINTCKKIGSTIDFNTIANDALNRARAL